MHGPNSAANDGHGVAERLIGLAGRLEGRLRADTVTWIVENAEYGEPEMAIDTIRGAVDHDGLHLDGVEQAELDALARSVGVDRTVLDSLSESRRRSAIERAAISHPNLALRERAWDHLRNGYRVDDVGPTWVTVSRERYWSRLARPLLLPLHALLRIGRRRRRDLVRMEIRADGNVHEAIPDGRARIGGHADG